MFARIARKPAVNVAAEIARIEDANLMFRVASNVNAPAGNGWAGTGTTAGTTWA